MKIVRRSPFSGKVNEMDLDVTEEQMKKFNNPNRKELIQEIFPNLKPSEREFILTGITPEEWSMTIGHFK